MVECGDFKPGPDSVSHTATWKALQVHRVNILDNARQRAAALLLPKPAGPATASIRELLLQSVQVPQHGMHAALYVIAHHTWTYSLCLQLGRMAQSGAGAAGLSACTPLCLPQCTRKSSTACQRQCSCLADDPSTSPFPPNQILPHDL